MGLVLLNAANKDRIEFYDELFLSQWRFMSKRKKRRNRVYKNIISDNSQSNYPLDFRLSLIEAFSSGNNMKQQILEQFGNASMGDF